MAGPLAINFIIPRGYGIHIVFHLKPVADWLAEHQKRSGKLFMDETTAPVLDPRRGVTKTGCLSALARDDRRWGGEGPLYVGYFYIPGCAGENTGDLPHRVGRPLLSNTSRIARSRASGENLFVVLVMMLHSQKFEPPPGPARFNPTWASQPNCEYGEHLRLLPRPIRPLTGTSSLGARVSESTPSRSHHRGPR